MPLTIEKFPEEFISLQLELTHHPDLWPYLAKYPEGETELRLLEIATYCTIIVDGTYGPADLINLAGILAKRLKERRPGRSDITIIQQLPPELLQ